MKHRLVPRDPTIPLVVVLVLVVGLVIAVSRLGSGDDETESTASPADGFASLPSYTGSTTESTAPSSAATSTATSRPTKKKKNGRVRLPVTARGKETCVDPTPDTDITVVSYNIKSGHGGGSLGAISAALTASGADVVLLQEVDQLRATSGNVDQPAVIGGALGMSHAFGANVYYGGPKQYGTAVLSRYPLVSTENTHLPSSPGTGTTQQRGLLHTVIDVEGTEVSIYDTHLQNQNERARMLQTAAINSIVAADPRPQILGGDFNAQPESGPLNVLKAHWTDTWGAVGVGDGRTHPARNLRGRIDYLMNAGPQITPLTADVLPAVLSDHRAVRAQYRIAGQGEPVCLQLLGPARTARAATKNQD